MTFLSRTSTAWFAVAAVTLSATLTGCDGSTTVPPSDDPPEENDFISGNPSGSPGRSAPGGAEDDANTSSGTGGQTAPSAGPDTGGEAERAIAEADIIQVRDGKLYALSQYSGLSIIDLSRRDRLALLGRYRSSGIPFEMYLQDGIVYAMFSSWGDYVYDEASHTYSWVQTSRVEALDVSNPAGVELLGAFNLPGAISDSRIVGDVLYAVSFEDGYCWECATTPNTTVTSLAIGDPDAIHVVDQLRYSDADSTGWGWRRSVTVTPERMYVAGIEWDGRGEGHSTIQIIDISDPGGQLVEGASVEADGQIQSRWQMDEHEGVLRVISQPGIWWSDAMPSVQTFSVVSSNEIHPLGFTSLRLPRPETLRSVRFDQDRAYAITAEQTDPLFTIDLSDPANPAQLGELEMPGWVYHMEPRGDRLLALGFDNAAPEGSLHVSLFDVSDMTRPTMLERIHFGGDWSSVAEDQDRIHKAFTILDELGTILVPYSGWEHDESGHGCGSYQSGIQLVDFTRDTLVKRGVAQASGQARRAFVDQGRLFSVSDEEVATFSIDNRDAPAKVADLALATIVNKTVLVGDRVARLSSDWWTNGAKLEVASASNPGAAQPIGELDLAPLFASDTADGGCYGWGLAEGGRLFAHGQHVYLVWPSNDGTKTRLAVIDVTNPAAPRIASQRDLPINGSGLYDHYWSAAVPSGEGVVQSGSTLVFRRFDTDGYYPDDAVTLRRAWLDVVDLSDPARPELAATVELPEATGRTALRIAGTTVLTSHWAPLAEDPSRARFYLDRIDVATPGAPVVRTPVNVPGSLLAWDGGVSRAITVDYEHLVHRVATSDECWRSFGGYDVNYTPEDPEVWGGPGTCATMRRTLKLVDVRDRSASLRDESAIEDGTYVSSAVVGDDRVFLVGMNGGWAVEGGGPYASASKLFVASGLRSGTLRIEETETEALTYGSPLAAVGQRLVLASYGPPMLSVVDASDLDDITVEEKGELSSYVYQVTVAGDRALCSLGHYGLEVVDLGR
jgi:hypothetical protein